MQLYFGLIWHICILGYGVRNVISTHHEHRTNQHPNGRGDFISECNSDTCKGSLIYESFEECEVSLEFIDLCSDNAPPTYVGVIGLVLVLVLG